MAPPQVSYEMLSKCQPAHQYILSLGVAWILRVCVVILEQESPAVTDKPMRRESMPKIAPIRR